MAKIKKPKRPRIKSEDLRPIVKARMKELGMTPYRVANLVAKNGYGQPDGIKKFIRGDRNTIQWQRAIGLLDALGIEVVLRPQKIKK
jgi:hypothetical protein